MRDWPRRPHFLWHGEEEETHSMQLTIEHIGKRMRLRTWKPGWWFLPERYDVKSGHFHGVEKRGDALTQFYWKGYSPDWEEYVDPPPLEPTLSERIEAAIEKFGCQTDNVRELVALLREEYTNEKEKS